MLPCGPWMSILLKFVTVALLMPCVAWLNKPQKKPQLRHNRRECGSLATFPMNRVSVGTTNRRPKIRLHAVSRCEIGFRKRLADAFSAKRTGFRLVVKRQAVTPWAPIHKKIRNIMRLGYGQCENLADVVSLLVPGPQTFRCVSVRFLPDSQDSLALPMVLEDGILSDSVFVDLVTTFFRWYAEIQNSFCKISNFNKI